MAKSTIKHTSTSFKLTTKQRLQLALDAGAIAGTWYWDVQQDHFTADARFARYFSLDVETMHQGTSLAEVVQSIHPDDEVRVERLITAVLKTGGRYCAEYRVRQLDGTYRWIEADGHVTLDDQGKALSFPGVLIDIHTRKQREIYQNALIALGDRLRDIQSVEDIAAVSAQVCGEILGVSRAGYGSIDGLGTHVLITADWCAADSIGSLSGLFKFTDFGAFIHDLHAGRAVAIEDVQMDVRTRLEAAALAALQVRSLLNVPLIQDGRLAGIFFANHSHTRKWTEDEIIFVRSVADRTWAAIDAAKAMQEMRRINTDLELEVQQRSADRTLLWQISGDLMLLSRFDAQIVAVNPAWHKLLGWSEQELVGRSLFDLVHPDDLARTMDASIEIQQGTSFPTFENRYRCKDGSYRHIAWSAGPAQNYLIATGRDITSIKEQQLLLQQAEDKLQQSQKMEAVGQLTGGIAHDFNNLLTIISTSVQLLRRPDPEGKRRPRLIDAISGAVAHASKLTGQLLAFARKQSLQPMVFDARHNIMAMTEMLQTLIGSRVTLEVEGNDHPYWVDADPGQFDTAIVNMAANARDAMDHVGHLRIALKHVLVMPAMRQHAAVRGAFVAISVSDTGSGIEESELAKIFEPFFTTKPVGQGTGLGLSQVFGFSKQAHGDVQVESTLGQGTTFTLYLPAATRQLDKKLFVEDKPEVIQTCGTVLLVEDNQNVAAMAQTALEDMGYTVHRSHSGADALEVLAQTPDRFVVMFTDVMMAGMDGITLAREVRRLYPAVPVLLSSGYSSVLASSEDRGFPLIAKPYGLDSLAEALRKAIHTHQT